MKKLFALLALLAIASCAEPSVAQKEASKSIKHQGASERINSTNKNSNDLFKEMEQ
jgi:hypothetical protein